MQIIFCIQSKKARCHEEEKICTHTQTGHVVLKRDNSNKSGGSLTRWNTREKQMGECYNIARRNAACQEEERSFNRFEGERDNMPDWNSDKNLVISVEERLLGDEQYIYC